MADIAALGIKVDSRQVRKGKNDLDGLAKAGKRTETATAKMERRFRSTSTATAGLANAVRILMAALAIRELAQYADTWKLVEGRLSLVTKGTEDLLKVQNDLFVMAQRTRGTFEDTAGLYARLARSTKELGFEQSALLSVTETINKSIIVSGASADSANAAIMQLGQGFASGVLRGEELNSVLEQTPRLAEAIAVGMGVTIGQLRALGAEGELTSEKVFNAILKQKDVIDKEFGKMPITIGQSFTVLNNEILKFIGQADKATGSSTAAANAITNMAQGIASASDDIIHGFIFAIATIDRTIDVFKLLFETASLGFNGIAIGSELAFRKVAAAIMNAMVDVSLQLEKIGATTRTQTIGYLTSANIQTEKANMLTAQLRAESEGVLVAAQAFNVTIEERMALMSQPAAQQPANNEDFAGGAGAGAGAELGLNAEASAAIQAYAEEVEAAYMRIRHATFSEEALWAQFGLEQMIIEEAFENKLIGEIERKSIIETLEAQHIDKLNKLTEKGMTDRQKFEAKNMKDRTKTVLGEMATMTAGVAGQNKAMFQVNKAAALANAGISMYEGISKTLGAYPYPINIGMAALHGVAALAQISSIASTSFGGGAGATSTPTAGGGTATTPGIAPSDVAGPVITETAPTKEVTIDLAGAGVIGTDGIRMIAEQLMEELPDMGLDIKVVA